MAWGDVSQSLARTLVAHLTDLAVLVLDRDLRIVLADGAPLTGLLAAGATEGRPIGEVLPVGLAVDIEPALPRALAGETVDLDHRTGLGQQLRVRVAAAPTPGGGVGGVLVILRDVTAQTRQARQFDAVFDRWPAPTVLVDGGGQVLRANAALRRLLSRAGDEPEAALLPDHVDRLLPPVEADTAAVERGRLLDADVDQTSYQASYDVRLGETAEPGEWARMTAVPVTLDDLGTVLLCQVEPAGGTARVDPATDEDVGRPGRPDPLTGLPDRSYLLRRLDRALARARRGRRLALLCCDLHGMRRINETLGRAAGDQVLAAVAERIVRDVRHWDAAARLGGDEFVVLCEDAGSTADVDSVSRRLRELVGRPMRVAEHNVAVGVTITVAASDGSESSTQLLHRAEQQMYAARAGGGVVPPPRDASH